MLATSASEKLPVPTTLVKAAMFVIWSMRAFRDLLQFVINHITDRRLIAAGRHLQLFLCSGL
jgi:hypothetical protein